MQPLPLNVENIAGLLKEIEQWVRSWSLNHLYYCATGAKSESFEASFTQSGKMVKILGPFGMWRMKIFHNEMGGLYTHVTSYMDATLLIDSEKQTITITIPMEGYSETLTLSHRERTVKRFRLLPFGVQAQMPVSWQ
jgi:hypothetical protein